MEYIYTKQIDSDKLVKEIKAAGLPLDSVNRLGDQVTIVLTEELQDVSLLDAVIADHNNLVIKPVSPRQIKTALVLNGHSLADIDTFIAGLSEPNKSVAQIAWEYSVEFHRDNELILSLAPMMGFTEQQLDDLFVLAATL